MDGPCQWAIGWDGSAGGFRGRAGEIVTRAYIDRAAVQRAIERGEVGVEGGGTSEASEGLVSNQQSSIPHRAQLPGAGREVPAAAQVAARRAARAQRLERARQAKAVPSKGTRRWRFYLLDKAKGECFSLDSKQTRLRRFQKRVHAWADALPREVRRVRRAGKRFTIGPRLVMLTLTYQDADAWQPNQIRDFMKALRRELGAALYGYAWVLEMQQRGAPHYHVLLYVKARTDVPKPDEAGLWAYGSTRRETAKSAFYISKYVGKEYQKEQLPKGARMFAVQIYKHVLSAEDMLPFRMSAAPGWLHPFIAEAVALVGVALRWRRVKGGGWVIVDTGEVHPSPYALVAIEPWKPEAPADAGAGEV